MNHGQIYTMPCTHSNMEHHAERERVSSGSFCIEHWYCWDCNSYFADEAAQNELTHDDVYSIPCLHENLIFTNGQPSICGKNGSIDCWYCSDCYKYFADESAKKELTYDDVYSVEPAFSEHEVLYDLTFEESADRYWVSPGILPLQMLIMLEGMPGVGEEAVVDRSNGTISVSGTDDIYTITYTYTIKYCAHCGAYMELLGVATDQNGVVLGEYTDDQPIHELAYVHQPGPVENDLVGYIELPTSNDTAVYGETYFDLNAFIQDEMEQINTDGLTAYYNKLADYLLTARVYVNDDKSNLKLVFSDDYIMGIEILEEMGIAFANYFKTSTNTCEHIWNDGVVTTNPTCTENGEETFTCTKCKTTKTQPILALGHSWDGGVVTKLATETEPGVCTYTCTMCKKPRIETIPKLAPTKLLEEINNKASLQDTSDDGTVYFDDSANLPANTVFDFSVLEKTDWYEIFDLKLTADGKEVEPETPVWVKIPVPAGWPSEGITVWHGLEQLPSFVDQNYIYFYTSHFSEFQIKYDKQSQTEDNPTPQPQPQPNANQCHWCGKVHNGFFQKIVAFFHNILAKLFGNKY